MRNLGKSFLSIDTQGRVLRFESAAKFLAPGPCMHIPLAYLLLCCCCCTPPAACCGASQQVFWDEPQRSLASMQLRAHTACRVSGRVGGAAAAAGPEAGEGAVRIHAWPNALFPGLYYACPACQLTTSPGTQTAVPAYLAPWRSRRRMAESLPSSRWFDAGFACGEHVRQLAEACAPCCSVTPAQCSCRGAAALGRCRSGGTRAIGTQNPCDWHADQKLACTLARR